jgi:hypothetical protein
MSTLSAVRSFDRRASIATVVTITLVALVAHLAATAWLNNSYAASGFPVPYHVAQLSFSAAKLQGWYGELLRLGTLGDYVRTQVVDFVFIASVAVLHPAVLLLIGRAFAPEGRGRRLMLTAAALSLIAPAADAAENLVSFVMLAQPTTFAPWLASLYSTLAALKFAMFTFAYAAAVIGVVAAVGVMLSKRMRHARAA